MYSVIALACLALLLALRCEGCWLPAGATPKPKYEKVQAPLRCTAAESERQLAQFERLYSRKKYYSACATHWWLKHIAEDTRRAEEASPALKRSTYAIADVGCNKGYFSAAALNYLAPGYGDHLQLLFKSHSKRPMYDTPCGMCGECKQAPPNLEALEAASYGNKLRSVDVLCYEPSEVHMESLTVARDANYGSPEVNADGVGGHYDGDSHKAPVRFKVLNMAVSNATGVAKFPTNCTGNTCSLEGSSTRGFVEIKLTTVDEQMSAAGLSRLDVLKIDTEGFDPAVLAGAYKTLRDKQVGALSFEYHRHWQRSGGTLRQCVDYLEDLGYSCFLDGFILAKLTGCWDARYEIRKWMNVVCAQQGSLLEGKLVAGSWMGRGKGRRRK